jgi:hypothetical protein
VGGATIAERPNLWFYVPYQLDQTLTADFVLQNEAKQKIHEVPVTAASPGWVAVKLPALELGKTYTWYFNINCNVNREAPIYVKGGIERIALDALMAKQLEKPVASLATVKFYKDKQLWYDAIAALRDLQQANPTDPQILQDWNQLLQDLKLADLKPVSD